MLIINRNNLEKLVIDGNIEITVLEIGRNRVRFGIKAPKEVRIHTQLKASPVPENPVQAVEIDDVTSPLDGLPAAVGMRKRPLPPNK